MTFVLEAGTVFGASWPMRSAVSLLCLGLDIFFFLELAVRSASAFAEGRLAEYIRSGGGWRDCVAAILPLVFTSGPFLFGGLDGLATTATVTALGSFRLLRGLGLLRILRLLRLFPGDSPPKNIRDPASLAASRAATLAILASLGVLILAETASIAGIWPDAHAALDSKRDATLKALAQTPGADGAELIALADSDLLLVRYQNKVVYTRFSAEEYHRHFGPDEIGYLSRGEDVEAFFSLTSEIRAQAASTLASGLSGLAILLALALGSRRAAKQREKTADDIAQEEEKSIIKGTVPVRHGLDGSDEPIGSEELEGLLGLTGPEGQEESVNP